MDLRIVLLAAGPGLIVWAVGLVLSRWATGPTPKQLGGRIATLGFALVFLGLAALFVLGALLGGTSEPA